MSAIVQDFMANKRGKRVISCRSVNERNQLKNISPGTGRGSWVQLNYPRASRRGKGIRPCRAIKKLSLGPVLSALTYDSRNTQKLPHTLGNPLTLTPAFISLTPSFRLVADAVFRYHVNVREHMTLLTVCIWCYLAAQIIYIRLSVSSCQHAHTTPIFAKSGL